MATRHAQFEMRNEYSVEVSEAVQPFRMDEYRFNQLNEHASTIQDNTGATGLVSEPQSQG